MNTTNDDPGPDLFHYFVQTIQPLHALRSNIKRLVFLTAVFVLSAMTLVGMAGAIGLASGAWESIFFILAALLGIVFALYTLLFDRKEKEQ